MNRKSNILAAILALITAVFMLCGCSNQPAATAAPATTTAATTTAAVTTIDTGAYSDTISIPGYEALKFRADETAQTVRLINPQKNACYFVMSLISDGETIWTSDYVPPGGSVTDLTLTHGLTAGEYDAVLHYDCFTLNDKSPLNGAEIKLKLQVN